MNNKSLTSLLLAAGLLVSNSVYADHNSVNGEGWANMPNDIHNTRIDTLGSDSSEFTDFVRYGAGADSVNRFATDNERSTSATKRLTTDASRQRVDRATESSRLAGASSNRAPRAATGKGRH